MNGSTLNYGYCFGVKITTKSQVELAYTIPSLMFLGKWWVSFTTAASIWSLPSFSIGTIIRSDEKMEYSFAVWAGIGTIITFQLLQTSKVLTRACERWVIFRYADTFLNRRNVTSLSLFNRFFHRKHSQVILSLVPPVLTFTVRTRLSTYSGSNHSHYIRILFVKKVLPRRELFFSPENR